MLPIAVFVALGVRVGALNALLVTTAGWWWLYPCVTLIDQWRSLPIRVVFCRVAVRRSQSVLAPVGCQSCFLYLEVVGDSGRV